MQHQYPGDFAEKLTMILTEDVEQHPSSPTGFSLSLEEVRQLLNTVFFASLLHEESRPIRLTLMVEVDSSELTDPARRDRFDLTEPVALSASSLRKLAPALDSLSSALVVTRGKDGLAIVGIRWGIAPQEINNRGLKGPGRFYINSQGPGELVVSIAGHIALRYAAGQGQEFQVPIKPGRYSGVESGVGAVQNDWLHQALTLIPADMPGMSIEFATKVRASELFMMAQHMVVERCGGAIIVASASTAFNGFSQGKGYSVEAGREVLSRAVQKYYQLAPYGTPIEDGKVSYDAVEALRHLRRVERDTALLTRIDGVLVLAPDLSLLRVGAKIKQAYSAHAMDGVETLNPTTSAEGKGVRNLGTRHSSAISYCWNSPTPALALIASQDGVVSLVVGYQNQAKMMTPVVFRPFDIRS